MIVGTKLRQLREERGIPLGLMAHYLNVSVSTLVSIERDKTRLTADQIVKVCDWFETFRQLNRAFNLQTLGIIGFYRSNYIMPPIDC
ncbi:helix-turn-helix domain-containing protein [Bacillus sp. V2I10]|uniref:helix-turn-helix domain-containing protein n=1 Tax=Bacillus sp. V2I10 TaxID=3042276 RepID=UPI00277D35BA|nr:transcriptional regulator with XRE-family HTH domain [Bacillus sp. V2I10]